MQVKDLLDWIDEEIKDITENIHLIKSLSNEERDILFLKFLIGKRLAYEEVKGKIMSEFIHIAKSLDRGN